MHWGQTETESHGTSKPRWRGVGKGVRLLWTIQEVCEEDNLRDAKMSTDV